MPTLRIKQPPTCVQLSILQRLIDGKSQKEIAFEFGKSLSTIKKDLAAARARVGTGTLYRLVAVSILLGWCQVDISPGE
jgi:DNA-binding NarL/FixJ family response regulator